MTPFQIAALSVVGILAILTLLALARGWATRRETAMWTCVWIAAAVTLVWPELTKKIAKAVGIGRGADLLLYCAVVVMMIGFLMTYVRLRRLRRDMTLLVRHLAIRDATQPEVKVATPDAESSTNQQRPAPA